MGDICGERAAVFALEFEWLARKAVALAPLRFAGDSCSPRVAKLGIEPDERIGLSAPAGSASSSENHLAQWH